MGEDVAEIVYKPTLVPNVKLVVASPLLLVVALVTESAVELAPVGSLSIANVTLTPLTGFPEESVALTVKGVPKVVATTPLCELPLINSNSAGVAAVAVAVKRMGEPSSVPEDAVT